MPSLLVTGGTGFIGSYIVRRLLHRGDRVVAYDSEPDRNALDIVLDPSERERVVVIRGDIRDATRLFRVIQEQEIDSILHLASLLIPACAENPALAVGVMGDGFVNVLEAMRTFRLRRMVWASSTAVFGSPNDHPGAVLPNDAPHHPRTVYAALKSLEESLSHHYYEAYGVDCIGLRYTAAYGVGRMRGISAFATSLMENPALGRPGTVLHADDVVDWQYIEDAAAMAIAALDAGPVRTRIYNTRCDIRPVREVVDFVRRIIPDAQLELHAGTTGIAWNLDDRLFREEIGYVPEWPMERGCMDTMNEFRRRAGLAPLVIPRAQ